MRSLRWFCYVLVTLAAVLLLGCGSSSSTPTLAVFGVQSVGTAGVTTGTVTTTWKGTWTDPSGNGPATFVITSDFTSQTASLTATLGGNVLGVTNPPPATFIGPYLPAYVVNVPDSAFGNLAATWNPLGQISGNLTGLPDASVTRVDFTGNANNSTITIHFRITLATGATQNGTLNLAKTG